MSKVYHNSFYSMGTRFNALFPSSDEEIGERVFSLIRNEINRIENKLSFFNPNSEVSLINRGACKNPVAVDNELFLIIESCLNFCDLTFGAFDITLRPLVDKYIENHEAINAIENNPGSAINNLILNNKEKSIFFKDDKTAIDFGGFGKGYALEKVKLLLDNFPIENAFISFGESSILTKGKRPDGNDWQIGILDFWNKDKPAHTFNIVNGSVSSSSNYFWNDFDQLCKKVNVINPFTSRPADELSIASVKSDSPILSEILSTAVLILKDDQIDDVLKNFSDVEAVKMNYNGNLNKKIYSGN